MAVKVGKAASVKLGTYKVAEMGKWSLDGITIDMLESTAFGDEFKQFVMGLGDYGTLSFGGNFDPTDSTGQSILDSALKNKSKIANIRFYVDNTSYYTPDVTTVSAAGFFVQSIKINFDKAGIGTIDFTGKCTGPFVLV